MPRDYSLMRSVLVFVDRSDEELNFLDFYGHFDRPLPVQDELSRLRREGLMESSMVFEPSYSNGAVKGLTEEGEAFLRDVEGDRVWALIARALEDAGLDLSYPLLKKVCETVVERYVMSRIPERF